MDSEIQSLKESIAALNNNLAKLASMFANQAQAGEDWATPRQEPVDVEKEINRKQKKKGRPKKEEQYGAGRSAKLKERGKSKNATSHETIAIPKKRVNLFEKSADFDKFKSDSKIDEKLWKGKGVSERGTRSTLVTMECIECEDEFEVSPNELIKDEDGDIKYICNDCQRTRR